MSSPILFSTVASADEVRQILELQAGNLPSNLTAETMTSQGFVTVRHEPSVLLRMNEVAPAIVAKADDRIVGYALVMPRDFAPFVPILGPLFEILDGLSWQGKMLRANPRWFVMGQICIAEGYRGMGIFDGMYRAMAETYRDRFDFTVTEVAARNVRSLRAHARAGFETLHIYPDLTAGELWHIVALDFREAAERDRTRTPATVEKGTGAPGGGPAA
jgi:hypothetical protein